MSENLSLYSLRESRNHMDDGLPRSTDLISFNFFRESIPFTKCTRVFDQLNFNL